MNEKQQSGNNKAKAVRRSLFVTGWRPAAALICAFSLGFNYLVIPIVNGLFLSEPIQGLNGKETLVALFILLGLGGCWALEKFKGVARKQ